MTTLLLPLLLICLQTPSGAVVTCVRQPAPAGAAATVRFVLAISQNQQEIENQYLANPASYARVLQYLNHDLAQDLFLRLPGRPDSVAAVAVSYPRQYGATGRSSVLVVFPVSEAQFRRGGFVTFRGARLGLETTRFTFPALKLPAARRGSFAR